MNVGETVGPYCVLAKIGEGGMGEVYRARDTTLRRDVAIKVLPEVFAADPDRLARFKREAELLATLNHPNIASVYGVEASLTSSSGTTFAIVLELVEGETLADRIARGPIDLDEAMSIARQIADALEAAHDRGVIHRDLKPANIKITPEGRVKVLDFGLAKMTERDASGVAPSLSPTFTAHETHAGVILGTAAYMSPEQARGKPVDRRTDIWAFGCVLFEMLSGRRTFEGGDTVSDSIAAILKSEPDWKTLRAGTPPSIHRLLRRCLQKDPQKRLPHIGLARLEIDEGSVDAPPMQSDAVAIAPSRSFVKRTLALGAGALIAGALGAWLAWYVTRQPAALLVRFPIVLDTDQALTGQGRPAVAISPDGTEIVYVADRKLFRRPLSDPASHLLVSDGTRAGAIAMNPVFSPDGRSIAYVSAQERALRRVPVDGGTPVTVCALDALPFGMSWHASGILFESDGSIMRVSADGGKPEELIARRTSERIRNPRMLPDGHTVMFTVVDATANTRNILSAEYPARIVAQSVKSGEPKVLVEGGVEGQYLSTGHLAYVKDSVLFAIPFDLRTLTSTGGPVPLAQGVRSEGGTAYYAASATGSLVYIPGGESGLGGDQNLALIDRTGKVDRLKLPPATLLYPRFSPDGAQIAVEIDSGTDANIWIYGVTGGSALRRLTFGGRNRVPAWSADGQRVAFQSDREGDLGIFSQRADGVGPAERLTTADKEAAHIPESSSVKGALLFTVTNGPESTLWTYSTQDRTSRPFDAVRSSRQPTSAAFSPDGLWVAYQSNETGTPTVYVQPFPPTGSRFQASLDAPQDDPHHPVWSRDGTELFYVAGPNRLVVTRVSERPGLSFSHPVPIQTGTWRNTFGGPTTIRNYDISPDGKRFVGVIASGTIDTAGPRRQEIQVVLNWTEELKQRTR